MFGKKQTFINNKISCMIEEAIFLQELISSFLLKLLEITSETFVPARPDLKHVQTYL